MPTRKPSKYGNSYRSAKSSFNPRRGKNVEFSSLRSSEATNQDEKLQATRLAHSIDEAMGFPRYESGKKKIGWLINMHSTTVEDDKVPGGRAGVDFYFLEDDGGSFKATVEYDPYFLIAVKRGREAEVEEWCRRMFEGQLKSVKRIEKEDLQMPNHLLGYRRTLLQLIFVNVNDLLAVRRIIMPIAEKNKKSMNAMDTYAEVARYVRLRRAPGVVLIMRLVPMLDSTFLMTNGLTMYEIQRLPMRVISLWTFGSLTFHTMSGLRLIKVGVLPLPGPIYADKTRYPHWQVVCSRSEARRYYSYMHRGATTACRPCDSCVRY
jgi:hypothetical protein